MKGDVSPAALPSPGRSCRIPTLGTCLWFLLFRFMLPCFVAYV